LSGPYAERLAAREIRRYLYLRTGRLLEIAENSSEAEGDRIEILVKGDPSAAALLPPELAEETVGMSPDGFLLRTMETERGRVLYLVGGSESGALYGAYRLAEHYGVRFYLHGDVIPDRRLPAIELPELTEVGRPLFELRGIQPFHDFPEGPDWWNRDDYKAILAQLPKLGMNFIGLHTYPEGGVGPEPAVWIGRPGDVGPDGEVVFGYPSRHFVTGNVTGAWGYRPTNTSAYKFGAAQFFDTDVYGAEYMDGTHPWTKMDSQAAGRLFDRFGSLLNDSFTFARKMGIKTCIGTETPLTIPKAVENRLRENGRLRRGSDPSRLLYEGMFQRISRTHPLDYYWLWTPEGWTWEGTKEKEVSRTVADFKTAIEVARDLDVPFRIATCGWVLGPQTDRALFDKVLPKEVPISCINRNVGHDFVEPGFAAVEGRPKWAIPWLEDDPALIIPQLWVGRMRKDAADALALGCNGLMGIHWRTRILGPNVAALARASWDQAGWTGSAAARESKPDLPTWRGWPDDRRIRSYPAERTAPTLDFYRDWVATEFGPGALDELAAIFSRLDCALPRPSTWVGGPGGLAPDSRPWSEVEAEYRFVDEIESLRPRISGAANLERFDYWLENFKYLRSVGELACTWYQYSEALKQLSGRLSRDARAESARSKCLPLRIDLMQQAAEVHRHLLATVSTKGELGTIANWQQHLLPQLLDGDKTLRKALGEEIPAAAMPDTDYLGPTRVIVPTLRTVLDAGEDLRLTAIVPGGSVASVQLLWRPMGGESYQRLELHQKSGSVYEGKLAADTLPSELEYYIEAITRDGVIRSFPAAGAEQPQTVLVMR